MRIGFMLRSLEEKGGIGIYTRYLLRELLARDRRNHYVLLYRDPARLGTYAAQPNVTERYLRAPNKALWDQVAVPWACYRERVDVVFHPKFTAPLLAPCKAVMVFHGADWFIPEHARYYGTWDTRYVRTVMPWYCRKCAVILSVSRLTTENFNRILHLPPGKVRTVYFAPARHFRRIEDPAVLDAVRRRYDLPPRFILTLSGGDRGRRKNIDRILQAYRLVHAAATSAAGGGDPHALVVGGKDCARFRAEFGVPDAGWGAGLRFPGWIEQEDLPAVYSLADLFLYPSNVEAFPIPLTEAMACGTPIVTSDQNGLEEIAGDAAHYVDAADPAAIAAGVRAVLRDAGLRRDLGRRGLERSARFSWDRCADETLAILESLSGRGARRAAA